MNDQQWRRADASVMPFAHPQTNTVANLRVVADADADGQK